MIYLKPNANYIMKTIGAYVPPYVQQCKTILSVLEVIVETDHNDLYSTSACIPGLMWGTISTYSFGLL